MRYILMNKLKFIEWVFILFIIPSCKKDPLKNYSKIYEVYFVSSWNASNHPIDYPTNARYPSIVAVSHLENAQVYQTNLLASQGLKEMAETGSIETIENDFLKWRNQSIAADNISFSSMEGNATSEKLQIGVSDGFFTVTAIAKISPSPDWFIGTKVTLVDPEDGLWYDEVIGIVNTYDAGTIDGNTYLANDSTSNPQKAVSLLNYGPLTNQSDTVVDMGYFVFRRIK